MTPNDDFYIGYLANAAESVKKTTKLVIVTLCMVIPMIAIILVISQRGFSTGTFELGNLTELEGLVHMEPYPGITIISGKDIYGNLIYQSILLVGYGKFGATSILEEIEKKVGRNLHEAVVKLSGTLIYNDGKTLFELTKQADSYVSHSLDLNKYEVMVKQPIEKYGTVELKGEVIDPKCYFGVMKPGEGKPHRSCAVRCISGGIPPMLAVQNEQGESNYYILLGHDYEQINDQVLVYVADQVSVTGTLSRSGNWFILEVDVDNGFQRLY